MEARAEEEVKEACCLSCRFGLFNGEMIFCRRFPPTTFLISMGGNGPTFMSQHPPTNLGNWCGEYDEGEPALMTGMASREGLQ